jgi:hypothetical protein
VLFTGAERRQFAHAYATSFAAEPQPVRALQQREPQTIEHEPQVETIEQPPDAGPHEETDAPPLHVRDPRE